MSNRTLCNICRRWDCICPKPPPRAGLTEELDSLQQRVAELEKQVQELWKWVKDEY